jgi:HlyD family secretion protein
MNGAHDPRDSATDAASKNLPLPVVDRGPLASIPPTATGSWRLLRFLPVLLLLPIGGVIGLYFQPPGVRFVMSKLGLEPGGGTSNPIAVPRSPVAQQQQPEGRSGVQTVAGLGLLLPESRVLTIAPPFGAGDARIAVFPAREGERVEAGAVLAVLDNETSFKAALASAEATLMARRSVLQQTKDNVILSRNEAKTGLERAEASLVRARSDFERYTTLRSTNAASEATFEEKRLAFKQAEADVERAKATLARYSFEKVDEQIDVMVAQRNVDTAMADVTRARIELDKSYVRAPITGTVLTINTRVGEKPGSAGILTLGNIDRMMVEAEVYQSVVSAVKSGQSVTISADALPRPLTGTVSRVGLEVGRQTLTDASPAANTDARVVKVYIDLDAESSAVARGFSKLQVTAAISVGKDPT